MLDLELLLKEFTLVGEPNVMDGAVRLSLLECAIDGGWTRGKGKSESDLDSA